MSSHAVIHSKQYAFDKLDNPVDHLLRLRQHLLLIPACQLVLIIR